MAQFSLEKALAGKPVVTRDGAKVTQLKQFDVDGEFSLVGVVNGELLTFTINGSEYNDDEESDNDLFIQSELVTGFVNVYSDNSRPKGVRFGNRIYDSPEAAKGGQKSGAVAISQVSYEQN